MTLGVACFAGVSAMQYQPMMGFGDKRLGDIFYKPLFHAVWSGAAFWYKTYAVTHAKNVCIDSHC
jgi:hypothetical protein